MFSALGRDRLARNRVSQLYPPTDHHYAPRVVGHGLGRGSHPVHRPPGWPVGQLGPAHDLGSASDVRPPSLLLVAMLAFRREVTAWSSCVEIGKADLWCERCDAQTDVKGFCSC